MARYMEVEVFKSKMQRAMEMVRKVLHATKVPQFAADVHHQYEDKYLLAERMTNAACASQLNCLEVFGLTEEHVAQLREWSKTHAVSLRFRAEQHCRFSREASRELESSSKRVEEVSVAGALQAAFTSKVVHTVTEYFWTLESSYELTAVRGAGGEPSDRLTILKRTGHDELITTTNSSPHPEARVPAADFDVNVSWLFRQLAEGSASPGFRIDRESSKCYTPRRNPCVDNGFEHFVKLADWAKKVVAYVDQLLQVQPDPTKKLDLKSIRTSSVFAPLLPLCEAEAQESPARGALEQPEGGAAVSDTSAATPAADSGPAQGALVVLASGDSPAGTALLPLADMNRLLGEERRALDEQIADARTTIPASSAVATSTEAVVVIVLRHCASVCEQWAEVLDYIEGMLRSQLISAIGKEVTPADFAEYMRFHSRKLFAEQYAPAPFCFAVRRSERHSPEGTLSVEEEKVGPGGDSNIAAPVVTLSSKSSRPRPMHFALSSSTIVSFGGDVHLHAYLAHQFSGHSGAKLSLVSRARQFSSFIVLVGRIASAHDFEPKYAAIVQNKDELTIPLKVSTIPTPKEFKDAIESLSPEQQSFAKAFRAMQLESTLFGILVIQIKPQLEKVLNLPQDSLTKEIKLMQDLMKLFIEYQVPSDLLSFDGRDPATGTEIVEAGASEALEAVRGHVNAMNEMIEAEKKEEIEERHKEATYADPFADREMDRDLRPRSMKSMQSKTMRMKCSAPVQMQAMMRCAAPPPPASGPPPMMAAPAMMSAPAPSPAPSPAPACAPEQPGQPQQPKETPPAADAEPGIRDYTQVPKMMDSRFEELDTDSALRPSVISTGDIWTKRAQKALLAKPESKSLSGDEQKKERDAAFDLLDALTKSGALRVDCASLHVVVAATHCFDKTVTETVVQDNVNPIEKVERSMLIMASTVHERPAAALIQEAQRQRVASASPALFLDDVAA